jgi:hypothetical protein
MLMQYYPTFPQGIFVPAEYRLAAAVCLVSLTILLVSLAVSMGRSFYKPPLIMRPPGRLKNR